MIKGIVFDLDGTLTAPGLIDFAAIRHAIGCPGDQTILEFLAELRGHDEAAHDQALATVERFEAEAARNVRAAANLEPFLTWLETTGLRRAIFTRNARTSTLLSLELLGLLDRFDPVIAREDAPPKPSPDGIFQIATGWGLEPAELIVLGDFKYDIEAGARAGAHPVQYTGGRPGPIYPLAEFVVDDLLELPGVVARLNRS